MTKTKIIIMLLSLILIGMGVGIYFELKGDSIETSNKSTEAEEVSYEEKNVDFSNTNEINVNLDSVSNVYYITNTGVYHFAGTLNGYINVNTKVNVQIILDNVTINNTNGPCIYVENVKNLYIELIGNNTLTDGSSYNGFEEDVNATIYSKDDLIIYGEGTLNINANNEDGIVSKDDLVIESGTYIINSKDDAIRGKDSVVIENGEFTIVSGGDGIKSTNETDVDKGNILIQNGTFNIRASGDAVHSIKNLEIDNGEFIIVTGNGAQNTSFYRGMDGNSSKSDISQKGLKAGGDILIKTGTFNINSYDDGIHSDNAVQINNGTYLISSSDDGIHGDYSVLINNGTVTITTSYEGIEANNITINDGTINLVAKDDGINVSGGADSSGFGPMGRTTRESNSSDNKLMINGGTIYVNSSGDGLDANGSIYLNGGLVTVDGPTDNGNGPLDYDGNFEITGGTVIAAGSAGMMQNATSSNQGTVLIYFSSTQSGGTEVSIGDITYTPSKNFGCILISSNKLEVGKTYDVKLNGTTYTSVTLSNTINSVGSGNSVNGMGRGNRGGRW